MQKILVRLFIAISFLSTAAAAQAAQINHTSPLVFSGITTFFGASFEKPDSGKTFSQNFTFTYNSRFDVTSAVISIALSNISSLAISSFTLSGNGHTYVGTQSSSGHVVSYSLSAANLQSGNYTLAVNGTVTGLRGGSFGGNLNISAVPENSTVAMLLAGLGLAGGVAWRRRRTASRMAALPA